MAELRNIGVPSKHTIGAIGDTCIDILTGKVYKCTFAYRTSNGDRICDWKDTGDVAEITEVQKIDISKELAVTAVAEEVKALIEEPAMEIPEIVDPPEPPKREYETYTTSKSQPKRTNYTKYHKNNKR